MPNPAAFIAVDGGVYDAGRDEVERKQYNGILEDGVQRLKQAGHVVEGELLVGDSVHEITSYARKIDPDLIVVGHMHLEGWAARWWRGATSGSLIENAHCDVLVSITQSRSGSRGSPPEGRASDRALAAYGAARRRRSANTPTIASPSSASEPGSGTRFSVPRISPPGKAVEWMFD